jgi:hypothetical protein
VRPNAPTLAERFPASPEAQDAPRREASWNVGAGLFSESASDGLFSGVLTPAYVAAIERQLGPRTWLGLNLGGSYRSIEAPPAPNATATSSSTATSRERSLTAMLGIRYVLLRGVVDASLYIGAAGSYRKADGETGATTGLLALEPNTGSRSLSVRAGFAVERELIERLSLRLTLHVLNAGVGTMRTMSIDSLGNTQSNETRQRSFSVAASPELTLRFYF